MVLCILSISYTCGCASYQTLISSLSLTQPKTPYATADFESAIVSRFTSRGVCGDVVVKEQLLDERQTRGALPHPPRLDCCTQLCTQLQ